MWVEECLSPCRSLLPSATVPGSLPRIQGPPRSNPIHPCFGHCGLTSSRRSSRISPGESGVPALELPECLRIPPDLKIGRSALNEAEGELWARSGETRVLGLGVGLSRTHPQTPFPLSTRGRKGAGPERSWAGGSRSATTCHPQTSTRPGLPGAEQRARRWAAAERSAPRPALCACARRALATGWAPKVGSRSGSKSGSRSSAPEGLLGEDLGRAWAGDQQVLPRSLPTPPIRPPPPRLPRTVRSIALVLLTRLKPSRKLSVAAKIIKVGARGGALEFPPSPPWESRGPRGRGAMPGDPRGPRTCQTGPNFKCFGTYRALGGPSFPIPLV